MSEVAFALLAAHADSFGGAVLCVGPNGEALDTAAALEAGNGVIVVPAHDSYAINALDEHPQFKRVAVPSENPPEPVDRFEGMTVAQLREEAQRLNIDKPGRTHEDILASVRAAEASLAGREA